MSKRLKVASRRRTSFRFDQTNDETTSAIAVDDHVDPTAREHLVGVGADQRVDGRRQAGLFCDLAYQARGERLADLRASTRQFPFRPMVAAQQHSALDVEADALDRDRRGVFRRAVITEGDGHVLPDGRSSTPDDFRLSVTADQRESRTPAADAATKERHWLASDPEDQAERIVDCA